MEVNTIEELEDVEVLICLEVLDLGFRRVGFFEMGGETYECDECTGEDVGICS